MSSTPDCSENPRCVALCMVRDCSGKRDEGEKRKSAEVQNMGINNKEYIRFTGSKAHFPNSFPVSPIFFVQKIVVY